MLFLATLLTVAAFILMILFHEYGHAWAATRAGLKVAAIKAGNGPCFRFLLGGTEHRIGFIPFSGQCFIEGLNQAPAMTRLTIASAGLVASAAVGAALCLTGVLGDSEVLVLIGQASLGLAVCNLLPVPGFDGWVMLKAYLESKTK